jgi:hypothetical protein
MGLNQEKAILDYRDALRPQQAFQQREQVSPRGAYFLASQHQATRTQIVRVPEHSKG